MTDTNWLQAAQGRCAAATEGPWKHIADECYDEAGYWIDSRCNPFLLSPAFAWANADANFIAHARTDLPLVLGLLAEAAEALEKLEQQFIVSGMTATWCQKCSGPLQNGKIAHREGCDFAILSRIRAGGSGG